MKNKLGFTLIELLVVVLIIGILSAVAVPQYRKTVQKIQFSTFRSMAIYLTDKAKTFYLITGSFADSFDQLDAELAPNNPAVKFYKQECKQLSNMFCCITAPSPGYNANVTCGAGDYSFAFSKPYATSSGIMLQHEGQCIEKVGGKKKCNFINHGGASRGSIVTPQGGIVVDLYGIYPNQPI